jgi:acyl-coenzyme A thioesterase PaaI-like protein
LDVSPARVRAADALRRLGHAVVGHHAEDELFDRITETVDQWLPELEREPPRSRPVDAMKRRLFESPPADGEDLDHFPDCIVSGPANPMGVHLRLHRAGDDAVGRVNLGAAFEGAPGRAHGGIVAAVFDDVMGLVLKIVDTAAYTGELTVRYLAPTPVGVEIEFRARLVRRDGRKLFMEAEATQEGKVVARATGLFIAIERS